MVGSYDLSILLEFFLLEDGYEVFQRVSCLMVSRTAPFMQSPLEDPKDGSVA